MKKNPNSTPDFNAFASSLKPHQREYITAYVTTKVNEQMAPLLEATLSALGQLDLIRAEVETLRAQHQAFADRAKDDDKYILTRGKIIQFMKAQGIA